MNNDLLAVIDEIDDVANGIEKSLSVIFNHFFEEFHEEIAACNRLAPNIGDYLETFADMIEITADRIHDENKKLKAISEKMYSKYRANIMKGA